MTAGQPSDRPQRSGGSIVLGLVVSLVVLGLAAFVLLDGVGGELGAMLIGVATTYAPIGLLGVGIVLVSMPRTRRTGAGILIGFGAAILIAGGVCVALLAQFNSMYGG